MSILIKTPYYNSLFNAAAKRRAAKWNGCAWEFVETDKELCEKLMQKYFGRDESEHVTLQVTLEECDSVWKHGIEVAGRTVARAFGRDSGAKIAEDIVIVSGGFNSGGSVKNWKTIVSTGTVILMRNFSKWYAEKLVNENPDKFKIIDESQDKNIDIEDL